MIEATIHTAGQLQVLRGRAATIRRGDQVALLAPDDADGKGIAGAVTGVRSGRDQMVALVVANRVHFVPADHDVVIIRDAARAGDSNGETSVSSIQASDPPPRWSHPDPSPGNRSGSRVGPPTG